jgi:hypothetical protein
MARSKWSNKKYPGLKIYVPSKAQLRLAKRLRKLLEDKNGERQDETIK